MNETNNRSINRLLYLLSKDDTRLLRFLHFLFLLLGTFCIYVGATGGGALALILGAVLVGYWVYLRRPTK